MQSLIAPLSVLGLIGLGIPASLAQCPQSCLYFSFQPGSCSTSANFQSESFTVNCFDRGSFSIPGAFMSAETQAGIANCYSYTRVADDFFVFGPPYGTPVEVRAVLDYFLDLTGAAHGQRVWAAIEGPDAHDARVEYVAPIEDFTLPFLRDSVLTTTLRVTAGEVFHLEFEVGGNAAESAAVTHALWWFDGLSPEMTIYSCKGYVQQGVPTETLTWGRIKATYR